MSKRTILKTNKLYTIKDRPDLEELVSKSYGRRLEGRPGRRDDPLKPQLPLPTIDYGGDVPIDADPALRFKTGYGGGMVEPRDIAKELSRAKTRIFRETLTDVEIRDLIKGKVPNPTFRLEDLNIKTLRKVAKELGSLKVQNPKGMKKPELIAEIRRIKPELDKMITKKGEVKTKIKQSEIKDLIPRGKLEVLSVVALRKLVAKYNKDLTIPRYNDLSKEELIRQIRLRVPSLEFKPEVQQPLRDDMKAGAPLLFAGTDETAIALGTTSEKQPIFTDLAVRRGVDVKLGTLAGSTYRIDERTEFEREQDTKIMAPLEKLQNNVFIKKAVLSESKAEFLKAKKDKDDMVSRLLGKIKDPSEISKFNRAFADNLRIVEIFEEDEMFGGLTDEEKQSLDDEYNIVVSEINRTLGEEGLNVLGGYSEDDEYKITEPFVAAQLDFIVAEKQLRDAEKDLKERSEDIEDLTRDDYEVRLAKQVGLSVEDLRESRDLRRGLRDDPDETFKSMGIQVGKRLRYISDKKLLELHRGNALDQFILYKELPQPKAARDVPRPKQVLTPPEAIKALVEPTPEVITPDPEAAEPPKGKIKIKLLSPEEVKERVRQKQLKERRDRKYRIAVAKAIGKAKRKAEKELGE